MRYVANTVFVLCLTAWTSLGLVIGMTVVEHGFGEVGRKLIHVLGRTDQLGVQSSGLVTWRLLELLVITFLAGYLRRPRHS
jgi:hypothetical protein